MQLGEPFSTRRLTGSRFADVPALVDGWLRSSALAAPGCVDALVADLGLIVACCARAVQQGVASAADAALAGAGSRDSGETAGFRAANAMLRLVTEAATLSGGLLEAALLDHDAAVFQRLRGIVVALLSASTCADAPAGEPRRAALALLFELAHSNEMKAHIAVHLFEELAAFVARPPLPLVTAVDDDDMTSRRACANVLIVAVRGSRPAKAHAIAHAATVLAPLADVIRRTPCGDFFVQLQCFELLFRVSRLQLSVINTLRGLPDVVAATLRLPRSPLASDANFVGELVEVLARCNARRVRPGGDSSARSSCPMQTFRASSFDATLVGYDGPYRATAAASAAAGELRVAECQLDVTCVVSPRAVVLLLPGEPPGEYRNFTFKLHEHTSLRISRSNAVTFQFAHAPRALLKSVVPPALPHTDEEISAAVACGAQLLLRLQFTPSEAAKLCASPLLAWAWAAGTAMVLHADSDDVFPRESGHRRSRRSDSAGPSPQNTATSHSAVVGPPPPAAANRAERDGSAASATVPQRGYAVANGTDGAAEAAAGSVHASADTTVAVSHQAAAAAASPRGSALTPRSAAPHRAAPDGRRGGDDGHDSLYDVSQSSGDASAHAPAPPQPQPQQQQQQPRHDELYGRCVPAARVFHCGVFHCLP
jgi:hypothetical protein